MNWNWFKKDPKQKWEKAYLAKLEEARYAQRSGDIIGYAKLTEEAENLATKIKEVSKS